MSKISTSTAAVAWMVAKAGRTQTDAADKFGITQGAISSTKAREDRAILLCESMPEIVEKAYGILKADPTRTSRSVAYLLELLEPQAKSIVLGIHAKEARNAARYREALGKVDTPSIQEQCAIIAEAIGGEYGGHIATAIRALQL